jgi:GTP-binding protein YchF
MRLGIIGLPQSGKTTVFNLLTGGNQPIVTSGGRFDVHTAVVNVPDERLEQVAVLSKPEKIIYAQVTYADIAGLGVGAGGGIPGQLLNQMAQMDGFLHVVRCFEDETIPHIAGSVDPHRDIQSMDAELLLNDLISVERKLERLQDERRKGGGRDKTQIEREIVLFERLLAALSDDKPLRDIDIDRDEARVLAGFGMLTRKPILILLNLGEAQEPPEVEYPHLQSMVLSLQGKLEMEIAQLSSDEAALFLEEYGIVEPGNERVVRHSYDLLGVISFFTIGDDEVRAWTLTRGGTAHEAAGMIHTDLYKGFIRAEIIPWDELVELGGLPKARSLGKLRLEGKDYELRDGEVMQVRFNI